MNFPKDQVELNEQGYRFESKGKCTGCGATILWYRTPKNRLMPLNEKLIPHWADCPQRAQFKKKVAAK